MNVLEMPATYEVESTSQELDLDSLFDAQPAEASAPVEPVTQEPEIERPVESFLPGDETAEPAPLPPPDPGMDVAMREVMEQIIEQNDFIRSCEGEVEDAKAELKMAKENYDKAVERLRSLCTKLEFFRKADENDAERPLLQLADQVEGDETVEVDSETDQSASETTAAEPETIPENGVPVRIKIIAAVTDGEGGKELANPGDEFAVEDQYDDGSVAVDHPTEGGIIFESHEFEVIEWQHEQAAEANPKVELQTFLGCSDSQLENFIEYGITSIPELCDAVDCVDDSENLKTLAAIKGVGKKKAEKILELVKSRR